MEPHLPRVSGPLPEASREALLLAGDCGRLRETAGDCGRLRETGGRLLLYSRYRS